MLRTSETINEIIPAIITFQAQVDSAKKDSTNPHFKSKYADLASVFEAIRPPLAKNNLAIIQAPSINDGRVILTTRIIHKSGQWIESDLSMKPAQDTAQSIGGTITYQRRYALCAMLGVVADEDDDGHAASFKPKESPKQAVQSKIFSAKDSKAMQWIISQFDKLNINPDVRELVIDELDGKDVRELEPILAKHLAQ